METAAAGDPHGKPFDAPTRRALTVAALAIAIVVLLLFLWTIANVLLLVFAAVLLGVLLSGLADLLAGHTPLSRGWALALVCVALALTLGGLGWLLSGQVASQVSELSRTLPKTVQQLEQQFGALPLLSKMPSPEKLISGQSSPWSRITGAVSATLGGLTNFLLILFMGIYFAVEPDLYKSGLVRLVPKAGRRRAREALDALGETLWRWLIARLFEMTLIGVLIGGGLAVIGVPLALTLGLLAGLLEFVPLIGPTASFVPAALMALAAGGSGKLLYTAGLFLVVQQLESNVITPLIMKRVLDVPPAVLLASVVASGILFGIGGVLLASPLAVVVMVLVRMLYVEDLLGDPLEKDDP